MAYFGAVRDRIKLRFDPYKGSPMTRAPSHLSPRAKSIWKDIDQTYVLAVHQRATLTLALEALDRAAEARVVLDKQGAFFTDRFGTPRQHPAVNAERDARLSWARLIRELALDPSDLADPRPPRAY